MTKCLLHNKQLAGEIPFLKIGRALKHDKDTTLSGFDSNLDPVVLMF